MRMKRPILTAICIYVAFLLIMGIIPGGQSVPVAVFALYCILTGVVEEAIFCGCIFNLVEKGAGSSQSRYAAMVTAVLFGVAHLSLSGGLLFGVLKVVQAALFSFCLVSIYSRQRKLWIPMAAHAVFDLLYFAAPYAATGNLPPYPAAYSLDANLVVLTVTTLFFAICVIIIEKFSTSQRQNPNDKPRL